MKLTRETWILGAAWAGVVTAGVGLLVVPTMRRTAAIEAEVVELRVEAAKPSDGPEAIAGLERELEALQKRGEARMTPIPEQSDVAGLMRQLSGKLDELGLDKRELVQGTVKRLEEASLVPMSVMVEGPFPKIYSVARYLEGLPRLVRVQRLRIALGGTGRDTIDRSGVVQAELLIDVFFEPRKVEAQASAGVSRGEAGR